MAVRTLPWEDLTHGQKAGITALTQLVGVEWFDEDALRAAEKRVLAARTNPYQGIALERIHRSLERAHNA